MGRILTTITVMRIFPKKRQETAYATCLISSKRIEQVTSNSVAKMFAEGKHAAAEVRVHKLFGLVY